MSSRSLPNRSMMHFWHCLIMATHGNLARLKIIHDSTVQGNFTLSQEFYWLLMENKGQISCYNEPSDEMKDTILPICRPLLFYLTFSKHGHYNEMSGRMVASELQKPTTRVNNSTTRLVFLTRSVNSLLIVSFVRLTSRRLSAEMGSKWKNGKKRLSPSAGSILTTRDSSTHQVTENFAVSWWSMHFSCFLIAYPVNTTGAQAKISDVEKWILSFGSPQYNVSDQCTAFINTDFINWTKDLGLTLRPRTAHSLGTNGRVETQNKHIGRYWQIFLRGAGNNYSYLAIEFSLDRNTGV